jgi:hypothetical protein
MLSDGISYSYAGYWWLIHPPALVVVLTSPRSPSSATACATRSSSGCGATDRAEWHSVPTTGILAVEWPGWR